VSGLERVREDSRASSALKDYRALEVAEGEVCRPFAQFAQQPPRTIGDFMAPRGREETVYDSTNNSECPEKSVIDVRKLSRSGNCTSQY
jgi:hypothetical protein